MTRDIPLARGKGTVFRQDLLRGDEWMRGRTDRARILARWRTRLLSKSLTATPCPLRGSLSPFSSPLLVSRHCRSRGIIVAKTSNNVPNDRLFSSGDIDLPANRKPVKMNPLNREQVPTPADFVTASRNATRINLPPRSKQEAFCAKERSR